MADALSPRQIAERRRFALFDERSNWIPTYREISEYQQPRAGRYVVTDRGHNKRHNNIYDSTTRFASRTLGAGMMSGATSPARPWFRMALHDKDLMEFGPVKSWLFRTGSLLREVFAQSNTYRALASGYQELGLFGTWATIVLPDFDNVLHHYPLTVGQYAIGTNHKGEVDTLCREFQMTVGQMVKDFGRDKCSTTVQNMYDRNDLEKWITVSHLIEPNKNRDVSKKDNRNMKWSSKYWESGAENDSGFLRESGFKRFPALCPRWEVTGDDVYGTSPGMDAMGDVKQLQHEQLRKAQGIDYQSNPPIQVPTMYKDATRQRLPGGVMYVDTNGPGGGVKNAFEVNLNLRDLKEDIVDIRQRINQAYYVDLFLMMANDQGGVRTATEIAERHEEKLLMLGPVLERLHNELLSPLVDIAFEFCADAGVLPPIPKELEGVELNVDFISVLAQAQRAVGLSGMDRLLGTVGSMAQMRPDVLDKINWDQVVDDYGDGNGVNPEIIVPDDVVAQIRADKAKAMQAQQAAEALPATAQAMKTAGETDSQNLKEVMGNFQGYTTPGVLN